MCRPRWPSLQRPSQGGRGGRTEKRTHPDSAALCVARSREGEEEQGQEHQEEEQEKEQEESFHFAGSKSFI